jgi:putative DNA primase/helicase
VNPKQQRIQFFDSLFAFCSGGTINFRMVKRNKNGAVNEFISLEGNRVESIESICKKYDRPHYQGIYHGIATRGGSGKKEHILEIPTLYADCDFKDSPREDLRTQIHEFPFPPSAFLFSGGGYQLYWFLKEAGAREDIPLVEEALRRIANYLGIPPHAVDASRVLRTPGTWNRKPEYRKPMLARLIECYPKRRYSLDDILDFLPPSPTRKATLDQDNSEQVKRLMQCEFIRWCRDNPASVSEPLWYALVSNIISIRPGGCSLVHNLSSGYPGYTKAETDSKILHALDSTKPHTCSFIQLSGFRCRHRCGVKSPATLILTRKNDDNKGPREWIPYEMEAEV